MKPAAGRRASCRAEPAARIWNKWRRSESEIPSNPKEVQMGLFTKDIKTMEDLFVHGLQDIYYAENQIAKSLPKMIEQATNRDLSAGLQGHLEETRMQIDRLKKVFAKLGKEPGGADCPAIDGIIKEADHTAGDVD